MPKSPVTLANLEDPTVVLASAEIHLCRWARRAFSSAKYGCALQGAAV